MTRYLISFGDGAMTFPEEELPDVAKAAGEVVQEARDAGWTDRADPQRAAIQSRISQKDRPTSGRGVVDRGSMALPGESMPRHTLNHRRAADP